MQSSSLLCSPNSLCLLSPSHSIPRQFTVPFQNRWVGPVSASSRFVRVPLNCSLAYWRTLAPPQTVQEIVETSKTESDFVEIGFICGVHGLEGEARVKPNTDFPELRFSKPGRRWLRQQVSGRETVQEVELVEGRGHQGQKGWIVRFKEVNTVDQARQLVGSTILVREEDRPEMEEGEFYSRDLVGMKVILKETGDLVGTVVNVFNSGANDLLHVMLDSSTEVPDGIGKPDLEIGLSGPLVWVPFVEAIVPNVDINRREMLITPPKGLLELNVRTDERSKKERRQLEWKQRKKFRQRLIAAKKKLCEMEQQHVFHGFRFGEKVQSRLLADQIVDVNSKLLQQALQNIETPSKRWNLRELIKLNLTKEMRNTLRTSEECFAIGSGEKLNANSKLQEKGHLFTSKGKVAIALVVEDSDSEKQGSVLGTDLVDSEGPAMSPYLTLQTLLSCGEKFVKIEDRASVPLILVCPSHTVSSFQKLFSNHDYFAFNCEKVWFLEEEKLPVVSCSLEEQHRHKILMKSPWEILQTPVGSGGIISLLSTGNILTGLGEMGVEYVELFSVNQRYVGGSTLVGLVDSSEALAGIRILKGTDNLQEKFHMLFSMKLLNHLTKQINKLHFEAVAKPNPHVEKVDREWVDIIPSSPNSYELRCSIYSFLNACPLDKVCAMEFTEEY